MSRRQYTTLVLSVSIPVPVGKTQAWAIENIKHLIDGAPGSVPALPGTVQVKLVEKKVTYL